MSLASISLGSRRVVATFSIALVSACATVPAPIQERGAPPIGAAAGHRSPFIEPVGAFFAEVNQGNVSATICVPGWTATVRPSTSYTQGVKLKMLRQERIDPTLAANYELDHFIPLALGGHPRSPDNLWLQTRDGEWSAKIKDRLERRLQVMVCAGQVTLYAARVAIEKNWKAAYRKYVTSSTARELDSSEEEVVD